ncbi:penicillin acylase family protein [Massilia sp. BJB1822]|uniref:penicillin acylase family protein n=1 Tax=Massilia sp. BJB1822 TaxID=2744470 RepID=UPI00159390EE|nr:penicillin acylase family protein [Massilia sp. BJB1822]NVE01789.1 penicillin acylase family protein [Massilia sp. BJB1822]
MIWVILPLAALLGCAAVYLSRSLPVQDGILQAAGLHATVSIERDRHGVPTIRAENEHDVYFALGFTHAQDRLWQMEMNRRIAAGRLSEVLGETTVGSDVFFRTLGLYRNAERILSALDPASRQALQAYVDGVNSGIANTRTLPVEYHLSRFTPEAWRPVDSLAWQQLLSWKLSSNFGDEFQRSALSQLFGMEKTNQLMPAVPADAAQAAMTQLPRTLPDYIGQRHAALFEPQRYVGSNAWVVSGKLTANGAPLLANDPHLPISLPSPWYLAKLRGGSIDAEGATFPGLPFIVVGRNRQIAWGMTTTMADTQDVVLERLNPADPNQYEVAGRYHDMDIHYEEIQVKSDLLKPPKKPVQIAVRRTVHGPMLSDVGGPVSALPYSVRWSGDDDQGGSFASFLKLNQARNWPEFNAALSNYVAPVHNFMYADQAGNIGFVTAGKLPLRRVGRGAVPTAGWLSGQVWDGWIPFAETPRQYNPERGYIVTANNRVVAENYPYHISYDWAPDFRATRISTQLDQLLATRHRLTPTQMMALQADVVGYPAKGILSYLKQLRGVSPRQRHALNLVRNWDGAMHADSSAATLVTAWLARFNQLLLDRQFERTERASLAKRKLPYLYTSSNGAFVDKVLAAQGVGWCDAPASPQVMPCQVELLRALDHALDELHSELGDDSAQWQWGKVHQMQFPHFPFSEPRLMPGMPTVPRSVFARFFHREVSNGGGDHTVNLAPSSLAADTRYQQFYGVSYRQLIELTPQGTALFIQNTGQSGNVLSPHYDDLLHLQHAGGYLPLAPEPARATLTLTPAR